MQTYVLHGSYYDIRGRWRSILTLNNKGAAPIRPRVTVFGADGEAIELPRPVVPAAGFLEIDLREMLATAPSIPDRGSVQVAYYGKKLQMGAQILVQDLERGLQFDEQLSYAGSSSLIRRETIWWRPSPTARVNLVLTNISDEPVGARILVFDGESRGSAPDRERSIELAPREQRVFTVPPDSRDGPGRDLGAASVECAGTGAVIARALVEDERLRYSLSLPFADPAQSKTSSLHGAGLRLSTDSGEASHSVLVARNVGSEPATVSGRLVLAVEDRTVPVPLPETTLGPGELRLIELQQMWRFAHTVAGVTSVGLELEYGSAPGTVVVLASTMAPDRSHVFRVPLIDPETPPSSSGGYPWRLDERIATVVHIKNTTNAPQKYLLQLSFPGGAYAPGLRTLAAGESTTIDIRSLREQQLPDALGRTIPESATFGQVHWSTKGSDKHALIGRAEHVDAEHGVAASYACVNCCPDNPYYAWTDPASAPISSGSTLTIVPWLQDIDCYENVLEAYEVSAGGMQWQSTNTSVATVSLGEVTSVGPGTASILGDYSTYWFWEQQVDCEYDPYNVGYETPVTSTALSITADSTTVHPNGAGGSHQTTIRVATSPATSGVSVSLQLEPEVNSGGHVDTYHFGGRPGGGLGSSSGTTDASGNFSTTYSAPVIGGKVKVKLQSTGQFVTLTIAVPGLQELGPGSYYELTGFDCPTCNRHPQGTNHWGTSAANTALVNVAGDYHTQFPSAAALRYNDQGLPHGGKFDLSGDWANTGSHAEHRVGINCDIYSANVPEANRAALETIFVNRGFTDFDREFSLNHWHVRYQ